MRVPVLAYHAMNIHGNDHGTNDHVALREDLAALHRAGISVVRLHDVVAAAFDESAPPVREPAVCLSFDDGSWFDWHDLDHPTWGRQRSFANVLRDVTRETGMSLHATSFVIASPDARDALDRSCMLGAGWWGHDWWAQAESEGLIAIESHSWDHNHDTLPDTLRSDPVGGRFDHIVDAASAAAQIDQASAWLDALLPMRRTRLLAWPYGQSSAYLRDAYLPARGEAIGLRAAFGTTPGPVTQAAPRWDLPRFVCGRDWTEPEQFIALVRSAIGD